MANIYLSQGKRAVIDDADLELVGGLKFCAFKSETGVFYATNRKVGPLHRFILGAPVGTLVDHVNGDGLDNRRCNLRLATRSQNGQNRRGATRKPGRTSQYLGVSWCKYTGRWRAVIGAGIDLRPSGSRRLIHLGRFDNEIDAARAYDQAAIARFGEFAAVNLPDEATFNRVLATPMPGKAGS